MKNWAGLVTVVLALTACGKSLQMKAKPEAEAAAASQDGGKKIAQVGTGTDSTATGDGTAGTGSGTNSSNSGDGTNSTVTGGDSSGTSSDPVAVDGGGDQKVAGAANVDPTDLRNLFDGQLTQISKKDFVEMSTDLPFDNSSRGTDAIRSVGAPACKTPLDHVRGSNVLFRSVNYIPAVSDIVSVQKAVLHLKGLRRYSSDSDLNNNNLNNQILCLHDTRICSGKLETLDLNQNYLMGKNFPSDSFSDINLDSIHVDGYGHVLSTTKSLANRVEGELELDIRELFRLENLDDAHFADWLVKNSVQYSENGYRKFRFVIGPNVYFESGELILQFITKSGSAAPSVPENILFLEDDAVAHEFEAGKCEEVVVAKVGEKVDFSRNRTASKSVSFSADENKFMQNAAKELEKHAAEIVKIDLTATAKKDAGGKGVAEEAKGKMIAAAPGIATALNAGTTSGVATTDKQKKLSMVIELKPMPAKKAAELKAQIESELKAAWN